MTFYLVAFVEPAIPSEWQILCMILVLETKNLVSQKDAMTFDKRATEEIKYEAENTNGSHKQKEQPFISSFEEIGSGFSRY